VRPWRLLLAVGCFVVGFVGGCSSSSRPREGERRGERGPALAEPLAPEDADAPDAGAPDAGAPDAGAPAPALAIADAPIPWSEERAALTLAYRRLHSDPAAKDLAIEPRVIVLHYTAGGTAKSAQYTFEPARLGSSRPELARGGAVNVSAHFLVDRDGTILQLQPETRYARHCIGLNHIAIGIENVGDETRWPLTDAQVAANAALVRELARRFPITHLLGHHEAAALAGHPYHVELVRGYLNPKPDPGPRFMKLVRAAVADLRLADR
jgi:hypothetical protein